jgi:hypothetical protein
MMPRTRRRRHPHQQTYRLSRGIRRWHRHGRSGLYALKVTTPHRHPPPIHRQDCRPFFTTKEEEGDRLAYHVYQSQAVARHLRRNPKGPGPPREEAMERTFFDRPAVHAPSPSTGQGQQVKPSEALAAHPVQGVVTFRCAHVRRTRYPHATRAWRRNGQRPGDSEREQSTYDLRTTYATWFAAPPSARAQAPRPTCAPFSRRCRRAIAQHDIPNVSFLANLSRIATAAGRCAM